LFEVYLIIQTREGKKSPVPEKGGTCTFFFYGRERKRGGKRKETLTHYLPPTPSRRKKRAASSLFLSSTSPCSRSFEYPFSFFSPRNGMGDTKKGEGEEALSSLLSFLSPGHREEKKKERKRNPKLGLSLTFLPFP